ncbi:MAG: SulP family inorganic anion transporter, partial [Phycisphaerales bacterium]
MACEYDPGPYDADPTLTAGAPRLFVPICFFGWPTAFGLWLLLFVSSGVPSMLNFFRAQQRNIKNDVLSGLTVSLALVPEAVAFAFVAGVSPILALYTSFFICLITAVIGGRPGMNSGATGAMA